jgi:hypothetical protein
MFFRSLQFSLAIACLSAAALGSCTPFDTSFQESRQQRNPPTYLPAGSNGPFPGATTQPAEKRQRTPQRNSGGQLLPGTTMPDPLEVEAALRDLETSLLNLEGWLGSTMAWDVELP